MAKFQLSLLSPSFDDEEIVDLLAVKGDSGNGLYNTSVKNNAGISLGYQPFKVGSHKKVKTTYIKQTISEFSDQIATYQENTNGSKNIINKGFCYTFDENLSIHKNAEKELSFSMLQKGFNNFFEWAENPFTTLLQIGSVLLLTDKHNKTYLFIVKNISYKFLENNVEYKYTCQDFFSYRYSRLGNGYSVNNDAASSDFIGSKTIDWWVDKIHEDCGIDYTYIPTNKGLCIYEKNGKEFIDTFFTEDELVTSNKWDGCKVVKILKHCDTTVHAQDQFPFSVSGSNAKAALISATEQIGYMINTYEYWDESTSTLLSYYWVEPSKNDRYSGLSYSPFSDVQDFSLSLSGDALTTVLNIDSVTKNNEEVTLIPEISPIFSDVVNTQEWDKSEYEDGMFTSILNGKTDRFSWEKPSEDSDESKDPPDVICSNEYIKAPIVDYLPCKQYIVNYKNMSETLDEMVYKDGKYYKKEEITELPTSLQDLVDLDEPLVRFKKSGNWNSDNFSKLPKKYIECEYVALEGDIISLTQSFNPSKDFLAIKFKVPSSFLTQLEDNYDYHFFGYDNLKQGEDKIVIGLYDQPDSSIESPKLRVINGDSKEIISIQSDIYMLVYFQGVIHIITQEGNEILNFSGNFTNESLGGFSVGWSAGNNIRKNYPLEIYSIQYYSADLTRTTWVPCYDQENQTYGLYNGEDFFKTSGETNGELYQDNYDQSIIFQKYSFNSPITVHDLGTYSYFIYDSGFYFENEQGERLDVNDDYANIQYYYFDRKADPIFFDFVKQIGITIIDKNGDSAKTKTIHYTNFNIPLIENSDSPSTENSDFNLNNVYGQLIKLKFKNNYSIKPYYNLLSFDKEFNSYIKLDDDIDDNRSHDILYLNQADLSYHKENFFLDHLSCKSFNQTLDLGFKPTKNMYSIISFKSNTKDLINICGYQAAEGSTSVSNYYLSFENNKLTFKHEDTSELLLDLKFLSEKISISFGIKKDNNDNNQYFLSHKNSIDDDKKSVSDNLSFNSNIFLFNTNNDFYNLKVYDNGQLVHDFYPYSSNGILGVYDRIGDKFLAWSSSSQETSATSFKHQEILPYEMKNVNGIIEASYLLPYVTPTDISKVKPFEVVSYDINLTQYSDVSEEDELFARIADQCPWLENVLVNFDYFADNKIIDDVEHANLLNVFKNQLRIINGKLMFYSKEYYNALRQKTKIIADVLSKIDSLGAWIKNNIIDVYQTTGSIDSRNDFNTFYQETLVTDLNTSNKYPILNFDDTISEYFNKYFKAQQRCLKNLYNFKNYFNQLNRYSNVKKYTWDLNLKPRIASNTAKDYYHIVWNRGEWKDAQDITINNSDIVALKTGDKYEKIELVTLNNYKNYFVVKSPSSYSPISKFNEYKECFQLNEITTKYTPIDREELFKEYINYLNQKGITPYYKDNKSYKELQNKNDKNESLSKQIFNNDFFKQSKINYNLRNHWALKADGVGILSRCYIANLPLPQLYCNVYDTDSKKIIKKPIQYIGNTWDAQLEGHLFQSATATLSLWTDIGKLAKLYSYTNSYYRKTGDPKDSSTWVWETSGYPVCYIDKENTQINYNYDLSRFEWVCDYWDLSNIGDESNKHGNITDCVGPMFASTNDWDFTSNVWSDYTVTIDDETYVTLKGWQEYYSKLITTYNYKGCKRYYKDTYWRFMLPDDKLKVGVTYYKIEWNKLANIGKKPPPLLLKNRISAIDFYFLEEYFETITVDKDQSTGDYFQNYTQNYFTNSEEEKAAYYRKDKKSYSIFIAEDFNIGHLINDKDQVIMPIPVDSYTTLYDNKTNEKLDWTKDGEFLSQYYYRDPDSYIKPTFFANNTIYYYKDNDDVYKRAYTMAQVNSMKKNGNTVYYLDSSAKKHYQWQELSNIKLYPLLQHIAIDENNIFNIKYHESPEPIEIMWNKTTISDEEKLIATERTYSIKFGNQTYTNYLTGAITEETPFSTLSNGEFWYNNYSSTNDEFLFQEAAAIESILTQYWTVAYSASLNCEYILPEHWQPTANGSVNYFKDLLYIINSSDKTIRLNPTFIPNITCTNSKEVMYEFHYNSNSTTVDDHNISIPNSNKAIIKALECIKGDLELFNNDKWYLTETGVTGTYYYVDDNSGMKWHNFTNYLLKSSPVYNDLSGNYVMLLRYLLKYYKQRSGSKYEELKREQKAIWYSLNRQYSNIILHNSFTPTDATTSDDVLYMAQNALKDLSQAERQYNITLLKNKFSSFALNNYQEQELNIGDPIALKTEDYWRQTDSIYNILKQYLFISDISYKLREDSSLKLTVNSLKYQDKLIQSLVKLIR